MPKKADAQQFDPNTTTPKEVDFQITPDDKAAYKNYVTKRFREHPEGNPTLIDEETWVRINRR
jgi:hypothetical protein